MTDEPATDKPVVSFSASNSLYMPKYIWHCEMFGMGGSYILRFTDQKKVPNWFWRKMQYLIVGNKWVKL